MDRKARSDLHQRRSRIARRLKSTQAVEFFNVLTSEELLRTIEALLPEHRERLYPWLLKTPKTHARTQVKRYGHDWARK